jgi:hypothetical protein
VTPLGLEPRDNSHRYPLNEKLGAPQSRSGRFGEDKSLLPLPRIKRRLVDRRPCSLANVKSNRITLHFIPSFNFICYRWRWAIPLATDFDIEVTLCTVIGFGRAGAGGGGGESLSRVRSIHLTTSQRQCGLFTTRRVSAPCGTALSQCKPSHRVQPEVTSTVDSALFHNWMTILPLVKYVWHTLDISTEHLRTISYRYKLAL